MARVVLGNRSAIESRDSGKTHQELKGKRATVIDVPDELSLSQAFLAITSPQGVWAAHSTEGAKPAWVAAESEGLATLLAEHFGGIEIRELEDER